MFRRGSGSSRAKGEHLDHTRPRLTTRGAARAKHPRPTRRGSAKLLAYGMDRVPSPLKEDERQTRRDLRAALVFGIVAAAIELGVILYFMR